MNLKLIEPGSQWLPTRSGPSNAGYGWIWPRLHVFVWHRGERSTSYGATVRVKRTGCWNHFRVVLLQRNPPRHRHSTSRAGQQFAARRTLTLIELSHWRTHGDRFRARHGLKHYMRVKVGAGGRQLN